MKRLILAISILLPTVANAQKIATSFQDATTNSNISIEQLDQTYQSALHSDSTKAAFKGQEKEFIDGYISLLSDLSTFLKNNNFAWGKQIRGFNRIYLNKNGEIDYFLFNFKEGEIEKTKEEEFKSLLNIFI